MSIPGQGLIAKARMDAGLSLAQLGERAGVARATVHKAEQSVYPSVYVLDKYAKALGLRLRVFYEAPDGTTIE